MNLDIFYKNHIFRPDFESKIITLLKDYDNLKVIIAGDSRAERQIIPNIFKKRTGLVTINIGEDAVDLITLYNACKKYNLLNKGYIFIISASSWQINDGALDDRGLVSGACIFNIASWKQLLMFKEKYPFILQKSLKKIVKLHFQDTISELRTNDKRIATNGFHGINFFMKYDKIDFKDHYWYNNWEPEGARHNLFIKTLKLFAESKSTIVLIQPPAAPLWYQYAKDTYIDGYEKEHSEIIYKEATKYKNIYFIDFYRHPISSLTNDNFYNMQHVNVKGAEILTNKIIDILLSENIINENL